jgi:cytochrome b involved in lipid metabolism
MKKAHLFLILPLLLGVLSACTLSGEQDVSPTGNQSVVPAAETTETSNRSEVQASPAMTSGTNTVESNSPSTPSVPAASIPPIDTKNSLTMAEVAKHSTASDCWMIIGGQVYDLSDYIKLGIHPGGDKILRGCGQEATAMFNTVDKHQNNAVKYLPKYLLGDLQ